MATITHEGECCTDCTMLIANGETPPEMTEDETEAWLAEIERRHPTGHACLTCSDDCEGSFSMSPCDYCGSHLGGDRHPFAVLDA